MDYFFLKQREFIKPFFNIQYQSCVVGNYCAYAENFVVSNLKTKHLEAVLTIC